MVSCCHYGESSMGFFFFQAEDGIRVRDVTGVQTCALPIFTYTHPVWDEQDRTAARAVLQRLGPSAEARRAKAPTLREKEYLHAVEVLYGDGAKAARDTAYSKAMERLVAAFPTDREAQVLYG